MAEAMMAALGVSLRPHAAVDVRCKGSSAETDFPRQAGHCFAQELMEEEVTAPIGADR